MGAGLQARLLEAFVSQREIQRCTDPWTYSDRNCPGQRGHNQAA